MATCLTSPTHGPAVWRGFCGKCQRWLGPAWRERLNVASRSGVEFRWIGEAIRAAKDHFASVRTIGGGRKRENKRQTGKRATR